MVGLTLPRLPMNETVRFSIKEKGRTAVSLLDPSVGGLAVYAPSTVESMSTSGL